MITKNLCNFSITPGDLRLKYLFSTFKESRGQALRDPLEHHFVLKISHFLGQVGPGRASPHATCKALNRYRLRKYLDSGFRRNDE